MLHKKTGGPGFFVVVDDFADNVRAVEREVASMLQQPRPPLFKKRTQSPLGSLSPAPP